MHYIIWIILFSSTLVGFLFIVRSNNSKNRKKRILINISKFAITIIFSIVIRLFIFEIYCVKGKSMEDCLFSNDYILVSKVNLGPKLPNSIYEIPWIGSLYSLFVANEQPQSSSPRRLKGLNSIKYNDIIVFKSPLNEHNFMIKRCVALPNDTILLGNKFIQVNSKEIIIPESVKLKYKLFFDDFNRNKVDSTLIAGKYDYNKDWLYRKRHYKSILLTMRQSVNLQEMSFVDSVVIEKCIDSLKIFVPGKRVSKSLPGFQSLNTKIVASSKDVNVVLNNDYYYVLGDNRMKSTDSRSYGVVKDDNIEGVGLIILFSINSNESGFKRIRWKRLFKMI